MHSVISLAALDQLVTISGIALLTINLWHSRCNINSTALAAVAFVVLQCVGHVTKNLIGLLDFLPSVLLGGVWYIGLSLTNLLAIFVLTRLHSKTSVNYNFTSNVVIKIFAGLSLIQVTRFFDRYYGFDMLGNIYQVIIPLANIVIISLLILGTVRYFWANRF